MLLCLCRGRYSYSMYRQMQYGELIASSPQEYVSLAVRLLLDDEYRAVQSREIQGRFLHQLHQNQLVAREWAQFLLAAHRQLTI